MLIALGYWTTLSGRILLPFQSGILLLQMRDVNVPQIQLVRRSATVNQPTVSTAAAAAAMDLGASADNNDNDNGDSGDITVIYHDASTTSSVVA